MNKKDYGLKLLLENFMVLMFLVQYQSSCAENCRQVE